MLLKRTIITKPFNKVGGTKGVVRNRQSKTNRQHNGGQDYNRTKGQTAIYNILHINCRLGNLNPTETWDDLILQTLFYLTYELKSGIDS